MNGTVKFFNETKGFGFVIDDDTSNEYFLHISDLKNYKSGSRDLLIKQDDKVEFELKEGKRGPQAANVVVL